MIKKNDRPKFVAEAIYTNTLEGKRVSDFFLEEASRYCNDEIDLAEFDETLVKRWLKQITVWEDHFTVELKSGLKIDIGE